MMSSWKQFRVTGWLLAGLFCLGTAPAANGADKVRFNRDILPILSDNCFFCHGPDENTRKAKLRLDQQESALARGVIAPGDPEGSELIARIMASDPRDIMPPTEANKELTGAQKELLKRWILEGAEYEPHWAFIAPERPEIPATKNTDWTRNPIDAFILETLESQNIVPSPEAERRALLRRLSLDLIGLPPATDEMEAFLRDHSARAYEKQVKRLLQSPHFGERMAVWWLDVVRYADTVGYHGDQNQNIFPYRDYVIDSFNANKPFDQFTREQLAGDLLPEPATEQIIATGFNRLNMMTREGGAQPKEYLAKYGADRVRALGTVWLGSTLSCAECHDHKYDPFTLKDFYELAAFYSDIKQWGVYSDYRYTPNPDLRGWSNDHPFPPEIEVASPYLKQRLERQQGEIARLSRNAAQQLRQDDSHKAAFEQWSKSLLAFLQGAPDGWRVPEPATVEFSNRDANAAIDAEFELDDEGRIIFTGNVTDNTQITLPLGDEWLAAIRVELLPHQQHDGNILRAGRTTTVSFSARLQRSGEDKPVQLGFHHAEADHKEERYSNTLPIIGVRGQWRTDREQNQTPHTAVWLVQNPVRATEGDSLVISLGRTAPGCVRISLSPLATHDPLRMDLGESIAGILGTSDRSEPETDFLHETYLLSTGWDREVLGRVRALQWDILECRDGMGSTMVTEAWDPIETRVLPRGDWMDESGEVVEPAVPHFLPPIPNPDNRRLTRLDLAEWLVAPENPLTARTFVNRLWKEFFGSGISAVLDDLGAQGEWPSHPELLDWLAVEFRESGWDIKHIVQLMVTSSTYRQDSNLRPELRDVDPDNRLLASQSPRRLDAEFVRDNALHVAGLLNRDKGGPSVRPYQPDDYYANLQFPNRVYQAQLDDRQYRRGVYMHWQRTFLHPMLANFDAPSREECVAMRVVSNTPQQALTLLNDPSFVEAARVFAENLLKAPVNSDEQRIDLAFQRAVLRPVTSRERESLQQMVRHLREHYASEPGQANALTKTGIAPVADDIDRAELAAWTAVCRVVLNLHETVTRY